MHLVFQAHGKHFYFGKNPTKKTTAKMTKQGAWRCFVVLICIDEIDCQVFVMQLNCSQHNHAISIRDSLIVSFVFNCDTAFSELYELNKNNRRSQRYNSSSSDSLANEFIISSCLHSTHKNDDLGKFQLGCLRRHVCWAQWHIGNW